MVSETILKSPYVSDPAVDFSLNSDYNATQQAIYIGNNLVSTKRSTLIHEKNNGNC